MTADEHRPVSGHGKISKVAAPSCKRLQGAPDARRRLASYTPVCEQASDKADGVPCDRLQPYRCGVLTLSDKGAAGLRVDESGPLLREILSVQGYTVAAQQVQPDDEEAIVATLIDWADNLGLDLIVTTGGTGLSPRDRTPEATLRVIDREVPGLAEAMRRESMKVTPHAMLARGRCGLRRQTLIVNLPGSKKAARENIETILPCLGHALYKLRGGSEDCGG